ncbi:MAG: hypothetical protein P4L69_15560 [Desulfosporosinus sp.]|nr:hypothetical protein [Desulfosporosinus sp.]
MQKLKRQALINHVEVKELKTNYEGATVNYWLSKIQEITFRTEGGKWFFKCSECGRSTSRDTTPTYYELKYPRGLIDQSTWKPFCSNQCAEQWVNKWFPRETEDRRAALEKKERQESVIEEEITNSIKEAFATWDSYFYQHKTYVNYIFSDGLTPNDRSVLIWLAGMWVQRELKSFEVDWETCLESIGVSEEEKNQSLENLTGKGWIRYQDDGSLTLHIPRKIYWDISE